MTAKHMQAYEAMQPEVDAAWGIVEDRVGGLPEPLVDLGRRFLSSLAEGAIGHRSYFSSELSPPLVYLPLWLRERFRREASWHPSADPHVQRVVAATMWGYFYIRVQDNQIDDASRADPELLLFGNVCCEEMGRLLLPTFNTTASFRAAFERAWIDFTRVTLEERRQVLSDLPYPQKLFEAHAAKVAFARVPALAVCGLAERMDLEGSVAELIHRLGIAYGLVNDVIGWPRDLYAGHRTYLLARAGVSRQDMMRYRQEAVASADGKYTHPLVDRIRRELYDAGLFQATFQEAAQWQIRALAAAQRLGLDEFESYTEERLQWLSRQEEQVQMIRLQRALIHGGAGVSGACADTLRDHGGADFERPGAPGDRSPS